jgi:hypothetical protein
VGEVELVATGEGNRLRMRTIVTDRDYHRQQLHTLTGIVAGDRQAQRMLDEITEIRATLSLDRARRRPAQRRRLPLDARALRAGAVPARPLVAATSDVPELYCQVLEHKWYLSEREHHDVGLERALEDYLAHVPV